MLGFKKFLGQYGKKYISVKLDDNSSEKLEAWCKSNDFTIDTSFSGKKVEDFGFHITILYSDNAIFLKNAEYEIEPTKVEALSMDLFGKRKTIPVILINKKSLLTIRKIYENVGLRDSGWSWKPHISVSYNYQGGKLDGIKLPTFDLFVDKIKIENQRG